MIEERRQRERVALSFSVEVVGEDGGPVVVTAVDLGEGGLQIAGDHDQVRCIIPSERPIFSPHGSSLTLRMALPGRSGKAVSTECAATVVYCRRLSQSEYRIGVVFERLPDESRRRLRRFLQAPKKFAAQMSQSLVSEPKRQS